MVAAICAWGVLPFDPLGILHLIEPCHLFITA